MLGPGAVLRTLCEGADIGDQLAKKLDAMDAMGADVCLEDVDGLASDLLTVLPIGVERKHAEILVRAAASGAKRIEQGARPHAIPQEIVERINGVGWHAGPGSELRRLVGWFAGDRKGCRCKERAAIMNRWGVIECRKNIEVIVGWLREEALIRFGAKAKLFPDIAYKTAVWKACDLAEGRENNEDISTLTNDGLPGRDDATLLKEWPFVWTYYGAEAVGDELKFSIRSVLHHWPEARVIVVGDKPDWFTGEMIDKPRIGRTDHQAFKDCFSKVLHMTGLLPQFTWMMDDIYFLGRLPMTDVVAPKYVRHVTQQRFQKWNPSNKWGRTRQRAYQWLLDRNRPTYDFASHLPQPIQSASFKEVSREAQFMDDYKNWECCYLNSYRSADAQDWGRRFLRVTRNLDSIITDQKVLNHTSRFFAGAVEKHLQDMFPAKSRVEK